MEGRGQRRQLLERDNSVRAGSLPSLPTCKGGGRVNWGTKLTGHPSPALVSLGYLQSPNKSCLWPVHGFWFCFCQRLLCILCPTALVGSAWAAFELVPRMHITMSHNSLCLALTTVTLQALHKHQLISYPRTGHPVWKMGRKRKSLLHFPRVRFIWQGSQEIRPMRW